MKRISLFLHSELGCLFLDRPLLDSGCVCVCARACVCVFAG